MFNAINASANANYKENCINKKLKTNLCMVPQNASERNKIFGK